MADAAKLNIEHVIRRTAVYTLDVARQALGLKKDTLRREVRLGRLRVAKRAGRYYVLGAWLLEWLEGGEIRRRRPAAAPTSDFGVG